MIKINFTCSSCKATFTWSTPRDKGLIDCAANEVPNYIAALAAGSSIACPSCKQYYVIGIVPHNVELKLTPYSPSEELAY